MTVLAGRYALAEELGRSGTGVVWRAEDRLLGRTVTVKVIHPTLADDPAFAERLAAEASRIASLSAPGFARLLDSGHQDGVSYLVREHVEGMSARSLLDRGGPLAPGEAARIAASVLEALAPAHDAGILHLALELDDVIIAADGAVRVTDLGVGPAVTAARPAAEAARLLGNETSAPERSNGDEVDARADVFAVGALLFQMLTGEPPGDRRSPRDVTAGIPRHLDRAACRALAPDAADRFQDVRAFADTLAHNAAQPDDTETPRRGVLRTWLVVPIAIAAVAIAATALGLWLGRLEVGGPLGIRTAEDAEPSPPSPTAATQTVVPDSVATFDPFGDLAENDSTAPLALDGDEATAWRSENYFDGTLNKDGVGLLFDLGEPRDVVGFDLSTPHEGYRFHVVVGDEPTTLLDDLGGTFDAEEQMHGELVGSGRYVLVWIVSVVDAGDGNRAEVSEFRVVVGTDG